MTWSFKIGLIIAAIAVILSVIVVFYDVSNSISGKITSSQVTALKWTFGFAAWAGICFLLYHFNLRGLGSVLLWLANIPAIVIVLFGLAIAIWGPIDFK